ncbi:transcription antitermination protein NusB [Erysipelothrix inopinata]|uniref:Transcription antitermination protein NusB n=1 Tax=Erysipelothrix inopinata TaxID=225084 RepID=A0A7G9RXL5_9FIRM|nr:transcription antitermination factor NusB [Erysipelothrix inopinata]QNN60340.1 transcription antitermination protein NusB [Erysipelothrix inopinata]
MSRVIERQNAMSVIYIHLMREMSVEEILADNKFVTSIGYVMSEEDNNPVDSYLDLQDEDEVEFKIETFLPRFKLGAEMHEIVSRVESRKEIYGRAIQHYLKNWRFDRLGFIEQSVLLLACAELELAYQPKEVIVNEAVRLAKEYGDADSYKYINGVLDAL